MSLDNNPQAQPEKPRHRLDTLPDFSLVRINDLVNTGGNQDAPIPISVPTFYRRIEKGLFPKPVALGGRMAAWRLGDVRAVLAAWAAGKADDEVRALVKSLEAERQEA